MDRIRAAIAHHDVSALKDCAYEIQSQQLGRSRFNANSLRMILMFLRDSNLLAMRGAAALLAPLEFDADKLDLKQRRAALAALEEAYPKFADPMARFQITEFIGRKLASREALNVFTRLMVIGDAEARSLVPHGFEHLVCSAQNDTAREAFAHLQLMASDPSGEVTCEALLSLERLTRNSRAFADTAKRVLRSALHHESSEVRDLARTLVEHSSKQSIPAS